MFHQVRKKKNVFNSYFDVCLGSKSVFFPYCHLYTHFVSLCMLHLVLHFPPSFDITLGWSFCNQLKKHTDVMLDNPMVPRGGRIKLVREFVSVINV